MTTAERIASNREIEARVAKVLAARAEIARVRNLRATVKAFRALDRALLAYPDGKGGIPAELKAKFYGSVKGSV